MAIVEVGAHLNVLQVGLVALRQARPRGADGMGRPGRPLRRSTRRYSSQRDEFHRMEMRPAIRRDAIPDGCHVGRLSLKSPALLPNTLRAATVNYFDPGRNFLYARLLKLRNRLSRKNGLRFA